MTRSILFCDIFAVFIKFVNEWMKEKTHMKICHRSQNMINSDVKTLTIFQIIFLIQAAFMKCNLFICNFAFMRFKMHLFIGTYPLISRGYCPFYIQIHCLKAIFPGPIYLVKQEKPVVHYRSNLLWPLWARPKVITLTEW